MRVFNTLIFILLSSILYGQNKKILSEKQYHELHDKARANQYVNLDSSFYYVQKIEVSDNPKHLAFAAGFKSYLYQLKNDTIQSDLFQRKSLEYLNQLPASVEKKKLEANLLNYYGLCDWKRTHLKLALEHYQKGKKIAEEIDDMMQIIKFNSNIALIHKDIGNYTTAINTFQQSLKFILANQYLYPQQELNSMICNTHLALSSCYEAKYWGDKQPKTLDLAIYHNKKSMAYSKENSILQLRALMNLGNIYFLKDDFKNARKVYFNALVIAKENNMEPDYATLSYNIGHLNFYYNKYSEALLYFSKVDSIYKKTNEAANNLYATEDHIMSQYYQAKIYKSMGNKEKALAYSDNYLKLYETFKSELVNETLDVNTNLSNAELENEMTLLYEEYKNQELIKIIILGSIGLLLICVVIYLIQHHRENKKSKQKIDLLLKAYSTDKTTKHEITKTLPTTTLATENKKITPNISIDQEKENQIIELLQVLEDKKTFLNQDFTQQFVAKKIKTNTTYLSHVVNNRFDKTFSEYANDLKINYVINEMINNPKYRKYTTQAIAESVGFKNAGSFRKSFSKKTGMSPSQFLKNLEERTQQVK